MDHSLFQKLTQSELDQYLSEIDLALEFHIKWLSEVNRTLICHTETDIAQAKNILLNDSHFERWYRSVDDPELMDIAAFSKLGGIHDEMVKIAREILTKSGQQHTISTYEYDQFMGLTLELRHQFDLLKNRIKYDLKLVAKLMGKVFENADEGVMITDHESTILSVNQAFVHVTGYGKEEAIGKSPAFLHSGRQDEGFYERMWNTLRTENRWQGKIWNRRKSGEIYPEWISIIAVLDDNGDTSHYIGIFSDVSTKSEGEKRLYHLAHYDNLCNLPNRLLFYDRLRQSLSRAKRNNGEVAVLFLDLDGFKEINDRHGHEAGDIVLQTVASRMLDIMRESDTIARLGGDEFTCILPEISSKKDAVIAAEKLIACIHQPYQLSGGEVNVSASIGISLYPQDSMDMTVLVKQSDMAMYKAKKEGKNKYCFYNSDMS